MGDRSAGHLSRRLASRQRPLHFEGNEEASWNLTACISLGAPFWFDMLNKLIVVRSTVKPKEKSAGRAVEELS